MSFIEEKRHQPDTCHGDDGTPVYRFRYRRSPMTQIGLMADDVERTKPEAVATRAWFKMVDYGPCDTEGARHGAHLIGESRSN